MQPVIADTSYPLVHTLYVLATLISMIAALTPFTTGRDRHVWRRWFAQMAFLVVQMSMVIVSDRHLGLVLDGSAAEVFLWLGVAAIFGFRLRRVKGREDFVRRLRHSRAQSALIMSGLFVLGGVAGAVYSGRILLLDVFAARVTVEGIVSGGRTEYAKYGSVHYVTASGREIRVTNDVFQRLEHGDQVRAEIGAGSGVAVRIDRLWSARRTPRSRQ